MREAIARRVELLRRKPPAEAHGPGPRLLFGEPLAFLEPLTRPFRPPPRLPRTAHPRVVMLLPGFGTHPLRMRRMARELERAGHKVKRWGLGFNLGPTRGELRAARGARAADRRALRAEGRAGRLEPRRDLRPRARQAASRDRRQGDHHGHAVLGLALRQQRLARLRAGHRAFGRAAAGRGRARGQAAGRDRRAVEPARRDRRPAQRLRPARRARPRGRAALLAHRLRQLRRGDRARSRASSSGADISADLRQACKPRLRSATSVPLCTASSRGP